MLHNKTNFNTSYKPYITGGDITKIPEADYQKSLFIIQYLKEGGIDIRVLDGVKGRDPDHPDNYPQILSASIDPEGDFQFIGADMRTVKTVDRQGKLQSEIKKEYYDCEQLNIEQSGYPQRFANNLAAVAPEYLKLLATIPSENMLVLEGSEAYYNPEKHPTPEKLCQAMQGVLLEVQQAQNLTNAQKFGVFTMNIQSSLLPENHPINQLRVAGQKL